MRPTRSSLVSLALLGLIIWYWAPKLLVTDTPEAEAPAVAVTLPPLEEPVEESEEAPEPAVEPEAPETVVEEPPEAPEEAPEEVVEEVPQEAPEEVVENTPPASEDQADAEQATPEEMAEAPAPASAPAKTPGPVTIVGRAANIATLVAWLQRQGGAVWLDDGHFSAGKIYELGVDFRITKVPLARFEQAVTRFAPRSMSRAERNALLRSLRITAPADARRLILLWPKSVWAEVQARASALKVDRVQVEYSVSGNRLRLRVISAQRNGAKVLDVIGQSI